MVSAASHRISRAPCYSGAAKRKKLFAYRTITFFGWAFLLILLSFLLLYCGPTTPLAWFGLFRFRSPLLTESLRFLFLRLLRCFNSPGSLHTPIYSAHDNQNLLWLSFLIRTSADRHLLTASRSLSQFSTSFIGHRCQGILYMLFVAWNVVWITSSRSHVLEDAKLIN